MAQSMYIVNLIFRNSNVQLGFNFSAFKNADEFFKKISGLLNSAPGFNGNISAEDDFDCRAAIDMREVTGVIFNDLNKEIKRGAEMRVFGMMEEQRAAQRIKATPANQIHIPQEGSPIARA